MTITDSTVKQIDDLVLSCYEVLLVAMTDTNSDAVMFVAGALRQARADARAQVVPTPPPANTGTP